MRIEDPTPAPRPRDPLWDTLVMLFGDATPAQRTMYGRVVRDLREMGATPEGMVEAATGIVTEWGRKALTPASLGKWYTRHQGAVANLPHDPEDAQMALRFAALKAAYENDQRSLP